MYYTVTLLNQANDKSTAEIILYQNPQSPTGMQVAVTSSNPKMKAHLDKVLSTEFYSMSPGRASTNEATVAAMPLQPGSVEYYQCIPEILGWKGYKAVLNQGVHKSVDDLSSFIILKSDAIYNNAKGQRIVKYVPENMMAVNELDGRVVMGGRYLNANIDKEDAEWVLTQNPYEGQSPGDRANAKADYEMGFEQYNPGMDEEAYTKRTEENDEGEYHKLQGSFKPEGKRLSEYFGIDKAHDVEEELTAKEVSLPSHLPPVIPAGSLVYSPDLNVALDSYFWPPKNLTGFDTADWYLYEYPNVDEDEYDDLVELLGMTPQFIKGARSGLVRVEETIEDISGGILMNLGDLSAQSDQDVNNTIVINNPVEEDFPLTQLDSPEVQEQINQVRDKIDKWRNRTAVKLDDGSRGIDPTLKDEKLPGLKGIHANFVYDPYDYQKAVIAAMVIPEQYEVFGGPRGYYGHYLNLKYGLGKTAIVAAADAIMRNKGMFKVGEQITLVTAPSKNIHVWGAELEKFRNESAVIISGYKGERIAQWESLLAQARTAQLPNYVIVAGSKFRLTSGEDEDGEETRELDLDAKYMKLLALGGKSQGKTVKGGHVAALVLDETGNYVNPKSSRFTAVSEISEAVYYGNGIVWTLNGDLSGNSATDTISEISFVNMYAKKNYNDLAKAYTIPDPNRPNSDARIWKRRGELPQFMQKFKNHIYSLDGETVAGDEFGLNYTEDLESPLGKNWGKVYTDALEKMEVTLEMGKKSSRALGMLSLLINASYGAVQPARMLEYDVGVDTLIRDVKKLLDPQGQVEFSEQLKAFWRENTEETIEVGRLPKEKLPVQKRDESYNRNFSDSSKAAIDKVIDSWDNPVLDSIAQGIEDTIRSSPPGKPVKLGVAGFSKRAIQSLYRRLKSSYNESKVLVLKFDGDTTSEEVGSQQKAHQTEGDKHVISLVTSAGLYGLSLAADRSWVFSTWNPAKLGQYAGRFHRNPRQANTLTIVVPSGAPQYVREISGRKKTTQDVARAEVLDLEMDDETEEFTGNVGSTTRLVDKLRYYEPRVLTKESKE